MEIKIDKNREISVLYSDEDKINDFDPKEYEYYIIEWIEGLVKKNNKMCGKTYTLNWKRNEDNLKYETSLKLNKKIYKFEIIK